MLQDWASTDFGFHREEFPDASIQQRGLIGWEQEYNQLGRGNFAGSIESLRLGGILIQRERFNVSVEQASVAPKSSVNFVWMTSGWRVNGMSIAPETFGIWTGGAEHVAVNEGGSDSLLVTVDAHLFGPSPPRPFLAMVRGGDLAIAATGEWLRGLLVMASDPKSPTGASPEVVATLALDRLSEILFRVVAPETRPGAEAPHIFRRVRELASDRAGDPLSVAAICAATGVTAEALQRAFADTVGLTPSAWLRIRRLNGARRDLRLARQRGDSVSAIAMKWGFWHLGRFSAYYREQFGEYPSALR
ncbi:MAG: helix-turn-helix domain-containing protein [Bauldia sp.]|nr:helix-turn-helix domain-containing protein [Bauldia sp.]MCW5718490.1 helix-turn-helix domain-containing protein [Bauldia sp.]